MDTADIARRKRDIEARFGTWTAHNIRLPDGTFTIGPGLVGGSELRLRQIVQMVGDVSPVPLERLRVLDLGALEGLFALEFARRGATVVAIEGREANLEKIRFARDVLGLERLDLRLEDVRGLNAAEHGEFDLVLCLGLLYHLDAPDVFVLLERMRDVCGWATVIETRVHRYPRERRDYHGRAYRGVVGVEPPAGTPALSRRALWSSIGNAESFELTRASLDNALSDAGYSSVLECHVPPYPTEEPRGTFIAFCGSPRSLLLAPDANGRVPDRIREAREPLVALLMRHPAYTMVRSLVPPPVRRLIKRMGERLRARSELLS
jgi:SAM-dependent methyltransferase